MCNKCQQLLDYVQQVQNLRSLAELRSYYSILYLDYRLYIIHLCMLSNPIFTQIRNAKANFKILHNLRKELPINIYFYIISHEKGMASKITNYVKIYKKKKIKQNADRKKVNFIKF